MYKKSQNNNVANGIIGHLISRNNDIGGYWGLGVLALAMVGSNRNKFVRNINKLSDPVIIYGHPLPYLSKKLSEMNDKFKFSNVHLVMELHNGQINYSNGNPKYFLDLLVIVSSIGSIGFKMTKVDCWLHDPLKEFKRG